MASIAVVQETEATGKVKEIYVDIKTTLGTDFIPNLYAELPLQVRRLLGELERGGLEVGVRPEGIDPVFRRLERLANRVVVGIIAAGFINALAVLMSVYHPPGWERWAGAAFALGFVLAAALGAYLAWSILRPGRG